MGSRYNSEAVETCFQLYLRYNGGQHDRIQEEMRQAGYVNWSKANLYDKGKGKNRVDGWISKYNWEDALKMKIAMSSEGVTTSAELLFLELEKNRRTLHKAIQRKGASATNKENRDLIYQYRDIAKLCIDALARLEAARDNYAGFAKFWKDLMQAPIPEGALRVLTKHTEEIINWAQQKYARAESQNAGSS